MIPEKNSTAACLWLLMLTLDADGRRKDSEFAEIQSCLNELAPILGNDPGSEPEALMASLNEYYVATETKESEELLSIILEQIDDPDLRQRVFVMVVRVAIADKQFHRWENSFLRKIGESWGLNFEEP